MTMKNWLWFAIIFSIGYFGIYSRHFENDVRRRKLFNTREKLNSMCAYFQVGFRLYGSVVSTLLVG